jgi:hypothetical protein
MATQSSDSVRRNPAYGVGNRKRHSCGQQSTGWSTTVNNIIFSCSACHKTGTAFLIGSRLSLVTVFIRMLYDSCEVLFPYSFSCCNAAIHSGTHDLFTTTNATTPSPILSFCTTVDARAFQMNLPASVTKSNMNSHYRYSPFLDYYVSPIISLTLSMMICF